MHTFVKAKQGTTKALCTLHLDDRLLTGEGNCPVFKEVLNKVNKIDIKEWKVLAFNYLGSQVRQRHDLELHERVHDEDQAHAGDQGRVDKGSRPAKAYCSVVMQMRWPCQHCLPEKLFEVSQRRHGAMWRRPTLLNKKRHGPGGTEVPPLLLRRLLGQEL